MLYENALEGVADLQARLEEFDRKIAISKLKMHELGKNRDRVAIVGTITGWDQVDYEVYVESFDGSYEGRINDTYNISGSQAESLFSTYYDVARSQSLEKGPVWEKDPFYWDQQAVLEEFESIQEDIDGNEIERFRTEQQPTIDAIVTSLLQAGGPQPQDE